MINRPDPSNSPDPKVSTAEGSILVGPIFGAIGMESLGIIGTRKAPDILARMNADHVNSMILLARSNARLEASEATMTSVDRMGFYLRLKTNDGMKVLASTFCIRYPLGRRHGKCSSKWSGRRDGRLCQSSLLPTSAAEIVHLFPQRANRSSKAVQVVGNLRPDRCRIF
jgi:hypothetical protein